MRALKLALVALALLVFARGSECSKDYPVPTVLSTSPFNHETGVATTTGVKVTFSTLMDRASVNLAFSIMPDVDGLMVWNGDGEFTFTPTAPLDPNTTYTVFIAAGAQSSHQVPMAPFTMSFTTGSQ